MVVCFQQARDKRTWEGEGGGSTDPQPSPVIQPGTALWHAVQHSHTGLSIDVLTERLK